MTSLDPGSKLNAYLKWLNDRGLTTPRYYQPIAAAATVAPEISATETKIPDLKKTPIYLFLVAQAGELKDSASRELLKKIIEATNINQAQLQIIGVEQMAAKLELFNPRHVLGFGVRKVDGSHSFLALPSLATLLSEPAAKRDVWNHLKILMAEVDFPRRLPAH